jgi:hypothetical protein
MRLTHSMASSLDFTLKQPEAGNQLLGFGEGAVDHGALVREWTGALRRDADPRGKHTPLGPSLRKLPMASQLGAADSASILCWLIIP